MARPRSFDREVALEQAMALFWERGYEATSVSELTQQLGISAPSLYAAFGSKRELFKEAVARYESDPRSVTSAGRQGTSAAGVLQSMFDRAVEEYTDSSHPRGCLVNSDPTLAEKRERNRSITASHLRDVAGNTGIVSDSDVLSAYVHVVLVGLSTYARDGASKEQLRRVTQIAEQAITSCAQCDDFL